MFSRWLSVGNVMENSLAEILHGEHLRSTRKALIANFESRQLYSSSSRCDPCYPYAPKCNPCGPYAPKCNPCYPYSPKCDPRFPWSPKCNPYYPTPKCDPYYDDNPRGSNE